MSVHHPPGCVIAMGAERRAHDRTQENLSMAARFERAWRTHRTTPAVARSIRLAELNGVHWAEADAKDLFRAGWVAAYHDSFAKMRTDANGRAL